MRGIRCWLGHLICYDYYEQEEKITMAKYVVTVNDFGRNNAGPKAKADINHFLKPLGYQVKVISPYPNKRLMKIFQINHWLKSLSASDQLMIQFPTYSPWLESKIDAVARDQHVPMYFLVHDVEALRMMKDIPGTTSRDVAELNKADGLIVHNSHMQQWLADHGVTAPMVNLGIFDYDNPQPIHTSTKYSPTVVFAGNLRKAHFLKKLRLSKTKLTIFGPAPAFDYPKDVTYAGQYSPTELPAHLNQCFGLVWDGTDTATCDGRYGNYMRYNDPHKASLYLSSGLPIIIWKEAALADFILDHGVGIAIDDLNKLDSILGDVTPSQYAEMRQRADKLATKLRQGHFTTTAVRAITQQ